MQLALPDFSSLLFSSFDELISEYAKTCSLLSQEQGYLGQLQGQYHREHTTHFWDDPSSSVAARNRSADYMTAEIKSTEYETRSRITQLETIKQFIENLILWRTYASREGEQSRDNLQQYT